MNRKSGFSLIEIIFVLVLITILGYIFITNLNPSIGISKSTSLKVQLEENQRKIKTLFLEKGRLEDLNKDNDYLDDLVKKQVIKGISKIFFEEPSRFKYQIRSLEEIPNNILYYYVIESTNKNDELLIKEAVKKLNMTDNNYYIESY